MQQDQAEAEVQGQLLQVEAVEVVVWVYPRSRYRAAVAVSYLNLHVMFP